MNLPTTTPANGAAPPARSAYANKNAELWRFGEALARSELIPKHFQGKPANVFLALQIADRMELDAFAVMSNLFVVHGTPAFSSKFLIGLANLRGPFKGPLKFRTAGATNADLAVTCYATLREDGTEVSTTVTMKQAEAAGWTKNSKYRELGAQMLSYRAATFFVRLYCPETAIMGARTVEEAEDIYASSEARDVDLVERNPLRAEIAQQTTSEAPQEAPRVGLDVGEVGGAAVDGSGGPVSAHAKAIAAFVALGVPTGVTVAEVAHVDAECDTAEAVTVWLRKLHAAAKKDGPRALITMLRSERACDLLDLALGAATPASAQPATDDLFPDNATPNED